MKLDDIVGWYQKKIGTYDKQQWEKTVEQKILDGFASSVTFKNAKLKTELIDVDLVRGSTFQKAKPKQTLLTVIRLAILRYLFLPLYAQWWVKQTSPNTFVLIFFLYITQMINWAIYMLNINRLEATAYNEESIGRNLTVNATGTIESNCINNNVGEKQQIEDHIVSIADLLIPMALSLMMSLIHSQIVATNSATISNNNKCRRFSNTSVSGKPTRDPRLRRRKKLVRIRPPETAVSEMTTHSGSNAALPNRMTTLSSKPTATCAINNDIGILDNSSIAQSDALEIPCNISASIPNKTATLISHSKSEEVFLTTTAITTTAATQLRPQGPVTIETGTINKKPTLDLKTVSLDNNMTDSQLKKRNVNWHTSLDSNSMAIETFEKEQQTSPQSTSNIATQSNSFSSSSSSTQASNSSSETTTPMNNDATMPMPKTSTPIGKDTIDQQPQQQQSHHPSVNSKPSSGGFLHPSTAFNARRVLCEDDGFESLNGKSSSGEDNTHSPLLVVSGNNNLLSATGGNKDNVAATNQLRLRLNVGGGVGIEKKSKSRSASNISSDETDEEGDDGDVISSPPSVGCTNECTTSATEWLGITTNSEDCCSYSSELEHSEGFKSHAYSDEEGYDFDFTPTTILTPHGSSDRISCTIWEQRDIKKAQMSVLEISSCIIERVESMPETKDYIYIGLCFSFLLSLIPTLCRLCEVTLDSDKTNDISYFELPMLLLEKASFSVFTLFRFAFGNTQWERIVLIIAFIQRLCLTLILFIIFSVAERTFKQRFLYAKLFSHLTSSRRARKSNVPHFRLNKVRNIKTWLCVRSYLKKRGPQRSVDIIVSAAFIVTLLLLAFLSVEWLKDSVHLHSHLNLEALMWSITVGIFLLRFMTLGNKIHHKYRSVSVLITEQINLYLQIEQKPKKKDELMVSNSVLKLAADLLKELESPFKISGLSANPYLFTTIKVVILSALSGVLSEVLGFKLKLHKIKIK